MSQTTFLKPEQVRAARSLLNWSQQDLATKAGVAVSTVADFERGQRSPMPNNALSIRQALERAGIVFTETGVSHGMQWTIMTDQGTSTLQISFDQDAVPTVLEFVSLFGKVDLPQVSINTIQCATPALREKLSNFIDRNKSPKTASLNRMQKMLDDMLDGEFFLLLPTKPTSSAEKLRFEETLAQLNHPEEKPPRISDFEIFDQLLEKYDLCTPRTDKRVDIGNARKANRSCRFCRGTLKSGSRFDKQAHAAPASLGNRYLKLCDECDDCNEYFGSAVEPTLVELLNIQRVFLGIESRGSLPVVDFVGGKMFRDDENRIVIQSERISEEASGVLNVQLGNGKPLVLRNFYRGLAKVALSVIPEEELPALAQTIQWARHGDPSETALPKIATAVVRLPPDPSAQITLYIRKAPQSELPHVVCEFRLGCYMYVYVLPFSDRDDGDLIGFFHKPTFKDTFRHYAYVPSWSQQDFSDADAIQVVQSIRLNPRSAQ